MARFPVKWISSTMRGAPAISGTPGTLIAALDAFLLHGWGQVPAGQIVVSGGIATATVNAGDTFTEHVVIEIAGATPEAVNGQARVIEGGTTTSVKWATDAPDGVYTGAITIKCAPVGGWEKPFSKTNVAVYRSTDPESPKFCYRVDDTGTTAARVRGFELMTDVDYGVGLFPTDAQISGGGFLHKSSVANSTSAYYHLVADGRAALLALAPFSANNPLYVGSPVRGFGEMCPLVPSDAWVGAVACAPSATIDGQGGFDAATTSGASIFFARGFGGVGGAVKCAAFPYVQYIGSESGDDALLGSLADSLNGQLWYCRRALRAGVLSTGVPRAEVPGLLHIPQKVTRADIAFGSLLAGGGQFADRLLLAVPGRSNGSLSFQPASVNLVDITGPWR